MTPFGCSHVLMRSPNDEGGRAPSRWTEAETFALVQLYNAMLRLDREGKLGPAASKGQTSKAAMVREFIAEHCPDRNKQSVEFKLMNVSYCRRLAGMPLLRGYQPASNCSTDLLALFDVERPKKEGGAE